MTQKPWKDIIPQSDIERYHAAGFGGASPLGKRPALLIIDVQYRTAGTRPMPFEEAVQEFQTSCGEVAWEAVANIERLLALFRERNWPVIYPYVAPKIAHDRSRLAEKAPGIMNIAAKGYEFVEAIAPREQDLLLPKRHPSAFFGTPLVSYLVDLGVDTLITTGCSTSGCVRGTVVDAFSYNFRVGVPSDAVYDRSYTSHAVNLFDLASKYAEVETSNEIISRLRNI